MAQDFERAVAADSTSNIDTGTTCKISVATSN